MKIDITSMFFNSKIEGQTATPAWGTSIGQNKSKGCRIDDFKQEVVDMVIGMTYKSISDRENLDVSKGSSDRDIIICSVFNDVYINNQRIDNAQYVLLLVREHSKSHDGRLLISYAPYIKYRGVTNQDCINKMQNILGCNDNGCWFVYEISIKNQAELYFNAVVVNPTSPMIYSPSTSSRERSKEWKSMIPGDYEDFDTQPSLSEPLQQIFYGAPGTGKSHRIKEIIKEHGFDEKEQVIRTTFHPDSDYSTFVGCYKPIMKAVPQTYVVEGNEKPVMADKNNQATKDEIVYDYTPQAFVQAYTKAWTSNKPIILVIEEINRGNCAQIFGDIFQLLDRGDDGISEYEIKPDKALENYLKEYFAAFGDVDEQIRSGKIMKLPANLYIWATMNTSDQSLFPIDSAFKRRWEWKYMKIVRPYKKNEDGSFKLNENGEKIPFGFKIEGDHDWWEFLEQINAIIDKMTNSADKQLGYFFAKAKDDMISYDTFVSKVCFYLWNDIFKTYALDEQQGDLFKFTKKTKDLEGNEKEITGKLTFVEFYDGDGNVIKEVAEAFIGNVMQWGTDTKNDKA